MRKLILLTILAIVPFFALNAQNQKKSRKAKQPERTVLGSNPNWANQASFYCCTGEVIIQTVSNGVRRSDTIVPRGDMDIYILLHNGAGDISNYFVIGGKGRDTCCSMYGSYRDTLFITGGFSDSTYFGDSTIMRIPDGGMDAFLLCITKTGKVVWLSTSGGSGDDCGRYVYRNNRGEIIARGSYDVKEGETIDFGTLHVTPSKMGMNVFEPAYQRLSGALVSDSKTFFSTD
jgi:hypothetical protein